MRVTDGSQTLGEFEFGGVSLLHAKPDSRWNKQKSLPEELTVVKAVAASVMGTPRTWHPKKSWSSTAA